MGQMRILVFGWCCGVRYRSTSAGVATAERKHVHAHGRVNGQAKSVKKNDGPGEIFDETARRASIQTSHWLVRNPLQ